MLACLLRHIDVVVKLKFFVQWGERTRTAWRPDEGYPTCFMTGPDLESEVKGVFDLSFERIERQH